MRQYYIIRKRFPRPTHFFVRQAFLSLNGRIAPDGANFEKDTQITVYIRKSVKELSHLSQNSLKIAM